MGNCMLKLSGFLASWRSIKVDGTTTASRCDGGESFWSLFIFRVWRWNWLTVKSVVWKSSLQYQAWRWVKMVDFLLDWQFGSKDLFLCVWSWYIFKLNFVNVCACRRRGITTGGAVESPSHAPNQCIINFSPRYYVASEFDEFGDVQACKTAV